MDNRRLAILGVLLALACATLACESGSGVPVSSRDLAARETTVAEATADTLAVQARATTDALAVIEQATTQAMDAQATAQAASARATAQARDVQATTTAQAQDAQATVTAQAATATASAQEAQATTQALNALATHQVVVVQAESTRMAAQATIVEATAQHTALRAQRERATQPVRTIAPWVLLILGLAVLGWVGYRFFQVVEDRARLIRRRPDEGEPILIWRERWALPLRAFSPLVDATRGEERAPQLAPTVEAQEAATMRQQTANAIQAQQVGAVAQTKGKAPILSGAVHRPPSPARNRAPTPGLTRVVAVNDLSEATAQGILPPRLAEAIDAQWHEVEEV